MMRLSEQRCFHHAGREAVARCPECTRYYCRECISEHEGRVICAACLSRLESGDSGARARRGSVVRGVVLVLAFFGIWAFFYAFGQALLAVPDSFHEGAMWRGADSDE